MKFLSMACLKNSHNSYEYCIYVVILRKFAKISLHPFIWWCCVKIWNQIIDLWSDKHYLKIESLPKCKTWVSLTFWKLNLPTWTWRGSTAPTFSSRPNFKLGRNPSEVFVQLYTVQSWTSYQERLSLSCANVFLKEGCWTTICRDNTCHRWRYQRTCVSYEPRTSPRAFSNLSGLSEDTQWDFF